MGSRSPLASYKYGVLSPSRTPESPTFTPKEIYQLRALLYSTLDQKQNKMRIPNFTASSLLKTITLTLTLALTFSIMLETQPASAKGSMPLRAKVYLYPHEDCKGDYTARTISAGMYSVLYTLYCTIMHDVYHMSRASRCLGCRE